MGKQHFDELTCVSATGSNRRVLLNGLAAALAALLGAGAARGAAACIKNGKVCDPKKPRTCCSGTCKKQARTHKCKPTPGAQGCTVNNDACALTRGQCPDNPEGVCVVLDNGKPFCALGGRCFDCDTDADCDAAFNAEGGICVKHCPACADNTASSACMFPEPIEEPVTARARRTGNVAVAAVGIQVALPAPEPRPER